MFAVSAVTLDLTICRVKPSVCWIIRWEIQETAGQHLVPCVLAEETNWLATIVLSSPVFVIQIHPLYFHTIIDSDLERLKSHESLPELSDRHRLGLLLDHPAAPTAEE